MKNTLTFITLAALVAGQSQLHAAWLSSSKQKELAKSQAKESDQKEGVRFMEGVRAVLEYEKLRQQNPSAYPHEAVDKVCEQLASSKYDHRNIDYGDTRWGAEFDRCQNWLEQATWLNKEVNEKNK